MTPVWRLHNGRGPSWQYGQAQVTTETSFQVVFKAKECFTAVSLILFLVKSSFLFAGYHRRHLGQQSCQRLPCCWWCHILRWGGFIHFKTDLQSILNYLQVCSTIPEPALIIKGECTFDRDACGWRNTTTVSLNFIQKSLQANNLGWQLWQLKIISKNTI